MERSSSPPLFGAWAFIRSLFKRRDRSADAARAELDREELREVEYHAAGMEVPQRLAVGAGTAVGPDEPEVVELGEELAP